MKQFHVADLCANGEVRAIELYDYATLERLPGCIDLIARLSASLYRTPDGYDLAIANAADDVTLRWHAAAPTAGIATIRAHGELASVSILATGISRDADQITLAAFQRHLTQELHDTGFEPAFDLLALRQRPLLATMTFHSPTSDVARLIVAVADRCFAASYFRYHGLA